MSRHWLYVARHFLLDFALVFAGFFAGTVYRFYSSDLWLHQMGLYFPAISIGACTLSCVTYILGLYAPLRMEHAFANRFTRLAMAGFIMSLVIVAFGYFNFSARIGRGVMMISTSFVASFVSVHHFIIYRRSRKFVERVVFIVGSKKGAREARVFSSIGRRHLHNVGIITGGDYQMDVPEVLGTVDDFQSILRVQKIDRILCSSADLDDPKMRRAFCQMRYSGINVVSLIGLCEEIYQIVPLDLVSPSWLLDASEAPQMLYIRKVKRGFDICASLAGLLILGPILLLGMLAVKLTSKGPIFYHQIRCGRFNKPFSVIKLRSMRTDAEKDGAQWSSASDDPRTTPVGKFLRKYRIDEIPQLINVLRGEMSFVGPRPERPEFVEQLAQEIEYFPERLLVQPGLTGWAQVNYPYASNLDDARRKLEYDLYYMKHMNVFLDLFILLDTVSIVLTGGLSKDGQKSHPVSEAFDQHFNEPDIKKPAPNRV
jgi:exopolysaccharide biosynthesis polyprenyl glycosylphosphotransferase